MYTQTKIQRFSNVDYCTIVSISKLYFIWYLNSVSVNDMMHILSIKTTSSTFHPCQVVMVILVSAGIFQVLAVEKSSTRFRYVKSQPRSLST